MQLRSKASQSRLRRICLENKLHRKASFSSSYVSSRIYFDNTDISYTSNPQLTTVAQPHGQLGKCAVEQLMRVMRKRETRNIILQHKIVRRDSTKN